MTELERLQKLLGRLTTRYAKSSLKKTPRGKAGSRKRVREDQLKRLTSKVFSRIQTQKGR